MPLNTQMMLMKKMFLRYNKEDEKEAGLDLSALWEKIEWTGIDPELSFPENRQILNDHLGDIFEVGSFTLYPRDTRGSEEERLLEEKGWRIHKEQVVKIHRVKGYEYGFVSASLPKDTVGHRVVLAVLDLTAVEEAEQQFRELELKRS